MGWRGLAESTAMSVLGLYLGGIAEVVVSAEPLSPP